MLEKIEGSLKVTIFWVLTVTILIVYLFFKYVTYSYWKRHGIPHDVPTPPFGNISRQFIFKQITMGNEIRKSYDKYNKFPFHGIYMFHCPVLMVNDPELIKHILVKEFSSFCDRGVYVNNQYDPLSNHLFFNNGDEWRLMRSRISPTFTSIKLKNMFPFIIQNANSMVDVTNEMLLKSNVVEVKDLLTRYTIDTIFNLAFGLNSNCTRNPDNEFYHYGKLSVTVSSLRSSLIIFAPKILKMLNMGLNKPNVIKFFTKLFKDMVEKRRMDHQKRKDFLNLLIELIDYGEIDKIQEESRQEETTHKFDVLEAAAQAFVFFIAGFETSSSNATYCIYELVANPDIQEKLYEEIKNAIPNLTDLTYEKIGQLEYLDMVLNETLRKHPNVPFLNRICIKDWKIPGSDYVIPKDMKLIISISGLHRNSNIFPDPDTFDPMRFSKENSAARHPYAYLPFGEGPRVCIGKRLGKMQTKIALVTLLYHYRFFACDKTLTYNQYSTKSVIQVPENVYLRVEKRKIT